VGGEVRVRGEWVWLSCEVKKKEKIFTKKNFFIYLCVITSPEKEKRSTYHY